MAKLPRVLAKVFGSGAGGAEIGVFGSFAAGSPATTTSPLTAQSLSNWLSGWYSAVVGDNSPAIEDLNSVAFVMGYQIAYLMQAGIPEYDSTTPYYINSLCMDGGRLFKSLTDGNTGNPTTDTTNWSLFVTGRNVVSKVFGDSPFSGLTGEVIAYDCSGGNSQVNLPTAVGKSGEVITVKKTDSSVNLITIDGNASETIDGELTLVLTDQNESATLVSNGTNWLKI